jgi:hypothetical protein
MLRDSNLTKSNLWESRDARHRDGQGIRICVVAMLSVHACLNLESNALMDFTSTTAILHTGFTETFEPGMVE